MVEEENGWGQTDVNKDQDSTSRSQTGSSPPDVHGELSVQDETASRSTSAVDSLSRADRRALMIRKRRVIRMRQAAVLATIVFLFGSLYFYRVRGELQKPSESSADKNIVVLSPEKVKQNGKGKQASREKESPRGKVNPVFAKVPSLDLTLYFLADFPELIGVGFHQASNPKAIPLKPCEPCFKDRVEATVINALSKQDKPIFFLMASRGRGKHPSSAADIGLKPGTKLKSPVDGAVTKSEAYSLYGRYDDWRLEIAPKEHPGIRIVMIHLDGVPLKVGDKVYRMKTVIGRPRVLRGVISPQLNKYIPGDCDHVHVQVNPYEPDPPAGEAGQPSN